MSSAAAKKGRAPQKKSAAEPQGRFHAFGWYCFLALVALTPLVIAAPPPQLGSLAAWRGFDIFDLPKAVAILVFSGLSLCALCIALARGESKLHWHPVLWVLVGLLGWTAVATLLAHSPLRAIWGGSQSNEGLVAVFGYALVAFLAIQYVRSAQALKSVAVAAAVSGSLVSLYGILQWMGVDLFVWVGDVGDRVASTYGNPNLLGAYLIFPLAMALGLALSTPRGARSYAWWGATGVIVLAIVATQTRGAWIGAIVTVACIGVVVFGGRRAASTARSGRVIAGIAALAVVAVAAAIVFIRPRMGASTATVLSALDRVSNGRTIIWITGLRGWLDRAILGWGPDNFERAFQSAMRADWFAMTQGVQMPHNAHGFPVQTLVTLGIPGLVLTAWALVQTAMTSYRSMRSAKGAGQLLFVSLWSGLIGLVATLVFSVTLPGVVVWLWLAVGLLLAPTSREVTRAVPKAVPFAVAALGVALAVWAATWQVADVVVGRAIQDPPSASQVAAYASAARLNPLALNYRWLVAEGLINQSIAEQNAGQDPTRVAELQQRGIAAFKSAAASDPGDPMVRIALANVLVGYAAEHPESDAAVRATAVAEEAVGFAPNNPAALAALARAYDVSGRRDEANAAARLARRIAPEYASQTLGSLGVETIVVP